MFRSRQCSTTAGWCSGESRISRSSRRICRIRLLPSRVRPLKETLEAIERADLITFGPGSLFTSVIPNLLVSGIPKAIRQSHALKHISRI